jgi:hypothetical protein
MPKLEREHLDYEIACNYWKAVYIGQPGRQFEVRLAEHEHPSQSATIGQMDVINLIETFAIALHALAEWHSITFNETNVWNTNSNQTVNACGQRRLTSDRILWVIIDRMVHTTFSYLDSSIVNQQFQTSLRDKELEVNEDNCTQHRQIMLRQCIWLTYKSWPGTH